LFTNPTESQKIINSTISPHVRVDITPFENHSWFSLRPAQQATNDNPLCFEKTGNAFAHLRCSTQSIMKNSAVFSPCSSLHFHKYRIGRVKRKKVELYKTVDLRWRTFCLRNMDECFHHPFTCVVAGPASCGKTEFVAKFILQYMQFFCDFFVHFIICLKRGIPFRHSWSGVVTKEKLQAIFKI